MSEATPVAIIGMEEGLLPGMRAMESEAELEEERRLCFVGITRAKRDLIVTWNTGRQGEATPSLAMSELMGWIEGE